MLKIDLDVLIIKTKTIYLLKRLSKYIKNW